MLSMPSQDKKQREREIVELVYGSRKLFKIDDNEQPDFLARLAPLDEPFGIEVTEFFQSESKARLDRIPGYVGELLDGGAFRHGVDPQELSVGKGQILSERREVVASGVPMIVQRVPPLRECAAMVAEVIRAKDEKLALAFNRLRHINLIVCDRTNLLGHHEPGSFYSLYCTEPLTKSLFGSRFREIYFVTRLSVGEVFVPLKMVVTLAHLYFFNAAARCRDFPGRVDSVGEFMRSFASYLSTIAVGAVEIRSIGDQTEVVYGDTGFVLDADLRPQLRLYFDAARPAGGTLALRPPVMSDPTITDRMRTFQQENTFASGMAFRVRSGAYAGG
jgi:hypothetical protein